MHSLKAGDLVPADRITKSAYFSTLVREYNSIAKPEHTIPGELVTLRNALAHGTMTAKDMSFPLKLVKFGKEDVRGKPGWIPVEVAEEMTQEWLVEKRRQFGHAIQNARLYATAT